MKLAIVIPAYNEAGSIENVLKNLPKKIHGIDQIISIVVDDGSTDKTFEIAKSLATYLVHHVINLGVGAATTSGLEAAKKLKCDIVVTIDADGQHNPKDIKKIIQPILTNKADFVIGTRMKNSKGMPILKIIGNWMMNILTLIIFRKWSTDSQSGMKALSKRALQKIELHSIGYEVCSELVGEITRNKLTFTEIPIEVIYTDHSRSKGQDWLNAVNILTRSIAIKLGRQKS